MILDFGFWNGRDDPAVVVPDSQPMINPNEGRFSLRRAKVKWAEGGASALPLTNGNPKNKLPGIQSVLS
jgi:hypothetical protein